MPQTHIYRAGSEPNVERRNTQSRKRTAKEIVAPLQQRNSPDRHLRSSSAVIRQLPPPAPWVLRRSPGWEVSPLATRGRRRAQAAADTTDVSIAGGVGS